MAIDAVEFPLNARRLGPSVEAGVTVLTNFNGVGDVVNQNRGQMRRVFNAAFGVRSLSDWHVLLAFYHAFVGPLNGFLVRDSTDYQVTRTVTTLLTTPVTITTQGVATNITGATWQLQKKYTVASRSHLRNIKRPKNTTVAVWFDGSPATAGVDYSIDYTTGVLTVLVGSPAAITWTGEFFVPCRFADKQLRSDLLQLRADGSGRVDVPDVLMIELL